jgi:hypothetical protein
MFKNTGSEQRCGGGGEGTTQQEYKETKIGVITGIPKTRTNRTANKCYYFCFWLFILLYYPDLSQL